MNKYEIIITSDYLYIKNYLKVNSVKKEKTIIELSGVFLLIEGNSLIITKMDKYDLIIKGNIKGISFTNEK